MFCSKVGTHLEERNFERLWYRLRRRAKNEGIPPLKLHATRHTWATLALQAGKNVKWVADQLGHADPALTLRVYAHALREEETDLSFLDFGGTKRHPRGTKLATTAGTTKPLHLTHRGGFGIMERETGIEPATLSLGS